VARFRMRNPLRTRYVEDITESASAFASGPADTPERSGFEYAIPPGGLTEYSQGIGGGTQTDRRSLMQQLYETYLSCPWAWASVNAISRTVTAGGLVTEWDGDDEEGNQEVPAKPANVLALERLLAWCNPREDIRQLMRGVVTDLLVFGDAFIEVVWVGKQPVALYSLDAPSMFPIADEHGTISKYVQVTDFGQRAEFEPRDVIHISLDAPRSGIFGVSPTQAAQVPITGWLFAAATGKEMFRKGLPPNIHIDFPAGMQPAEINRWLGQYAQRNIGPRNIGFPIPTKNGALVKELQSGRVQDVLAFLDQKRDEILAVYGVPPSKATVIEAGNLGGGTGESQDKTFRVNTCQPIAELVLEKINFAIVRLGFGITDWRLKFGEIDYRDSKTIEDIYDQRVRNGMWTLNRGRAAIGEPPVDGGDDPVIIDRQTLLLWSDIADMSKAQVAAKGAPAVAAGEPAPGGEPLQSAAQPDGEPPREPPTRESWVHQYRHRLREALRDLPELEEVRR
jgi:HK97 family phage portal protein